MSLEHPALKNFSPTWEGIKHVAGKALKWGAFAALAVGAVALLPAAFIGAVGSIPLGIGSVLSSVLGAVGVGTGAGIISGALLKGAVVGAVAGGISGLGGVGKAIDERKQDAVADYEQAMVSRERGQMMAMQRGGGQGYEGGVSPSAGYGRGRQADQGIGG